MVEEANFHAAAATLAGETPLEFQQSAIDVPQKALRDYYMTDQISRASVTMARCVKATASPISDK